MTGRLSGEVAVVTGSTHGIGRATAIRFASEGACVVVTGRDSSAGAEVLQRIDEVGGKAVFVHGDLTDPYLGEQVAGETRESFGPATILVNNAGSSDLVRDGTDRAISEIEDQNWNRIIDVNLTGAVRITRSLLRDMIEIGRGSIVNISSLAARVGVPGIDGYTAVKGALESLTRSIAVEYAEFGIRCNAIQVSFVRVVDERVARPSLDAANDDRFSRLFLTRGGRPDDVSNATLFLASREAEFITGVVLPVDGGAAAVSGMPWVSAKPRSQNTAAEESLAWQSTE
jgi:NAD(P)-dependent dehydrogenase (short-subunit alcohol dehydrogenase family)